MELVIDEGNTRAKAAIFINNGIHKVVYGSSANKELYAQIAEFHPTSIIISSVRTENSENIKFWRALAPTTILSHETPLPINNSYQTPKTLGKDRLAAVIGGRFLYPEGAILAIDAGTCITYDILDAHNNYLGGSISPGMSMRAKSLHQFTGALPEISDFKTVKLFGSNTHDAIATGILNGMVHEINGTIEHYQNVYNPLNVVVCGGEVPYFVNQIKKKIFANQNLVLLGLHKILKFNDAS